MDRILKIIDYIIYALVIGSIIGFFYGGSGADLVAGQLDTYIRLSIPQSTGTTLPTA